MYLTLINKNKAIDIKVLDSTNINTISSVISNKQKSLFLILRKNQSKIQFIDKNKTCSTIYTTKNQIIDAAFTYDSKYILVVENIKEKKSSVINFMLLN